jgi:hypothetical protein
MGYALSGGPEGLGPTACKPLAAVLNYVTHSTYRGWASTTARWPQVPAHMVRQPVEQTVRAAQTSRPLSMTWLPVCGVWERGVRARWPPRTVFRNLAETARRDSDCVRPEPGAHPLLGHDRVVACAGGHFHAWSRTVVPADDERICTRSQSWLACQRPSCSSSTGTRRPSNSRGSRCYRAPHRSERGAGSISGP